ncbi:MAG: class I SAM-dependent methyltransferase [Fimbriimonadaceae bacterium]|nr:class I SAM-dependent methyltransferase [Fimbriimonadaceae bacterium]
MNGPTSKPFSAVAPHYDVLMRAVPYPMWVSYYLLLLAHQGSHPRRVLDIACGTGTMTELLVDEELAMTGIDIAPGMIAEARRKAALRGSPTRYEVADVREFALGDTFEGALSFFDCLNNLLTTDELGQAFRRVYAHLEPGGSWIFDLNTAYAFEKRMFDQKDRRPKSPLHYDWTGEYDPGTRIITVTMRFWNGQGEFVEVHRQRAFTMDEVMAALAEAGFVEVTPFHSYTLDKPRKNSDRWHFACLRPPTD